MTETSVLSDPTTKPVASLDGGTLYLVDGSGFIFRAFHALPPLNRPDGTPVNAVLGFTNMMLKLLADLKADALAVVFDAARENFRNRIYDQYKANRAEPPGELVPQFALIRQATEAFCVNQVELEGYEADDLIATYAAQATARGMKVVIVSSDKDLMQLVGNGVVLFDPIKNRTIDRDEVIEKFGLPPERMVDLQALAGDSIDNVPGVPGIGVKTAAQLLSEFGDLETLLARAETIKQKGRREKLIAHAEDARLSKHLVQLDADVPVPLPLDALAVREPDHDRLIAFLREQGFRSVIARIEAELRKDGRLADGEGAAPAPTPSAPSGEGAAAAAPAGRKQAPEAPIPPAFTGTAEYELVQDMDTLDRWIAAAYEAGVVAVDTETDSLVPSAATLVGISLSLAAGSGCYVPLGHTADGLDFQGEDARQLDTAAAIERLKPLLEHPGVLKVGHNIKYDMQVLATHGISLAPHDDTMLLSYVLDGGRHNHGMDDLARLHCGHECIKYGDVVGTGKARVTFDRIPPSQARDYAAEDADITLRLWRTLKPRLVSDRLVTVYEELERPLAPVIAGMERAGIKVDPSVLQQMSAEFADRLAELEDEIRKLAGRDFNVGSPKRLGDVLFGELGISGGRKTKTGVWSTHSDVLEPLAPMYQIVQRVLDWRQLAKLKSTYTDALPEAINPATGRVHTSFSMAATNTGRLSSTDPNLQNIPIRTDEGRKIRRAFIAEPGHLLVSVDYSQIELRLVAEIAGIEALKDAFREGIDIHALTASQVFGVPLDQMASETRRKAKAINFGIIYGISGFGLAKHLGVTPGEAGAFIKQYLERYPELDAYMQRTKEFCREHGYVVTLFGRRCHIPGIKDGNQARRAFAERQAINAPIQGTAADIIKRAMIRMPRSLAEAGLSARLLLQVHDELLFEAPEAEAEATGAVARRVMEAAASLGVPLVAEVGFGPTWADAH